MSIAFAFHHLVVASAACGRLIPFLGILVASAVPGGGNDLQDPAASGDYVGGMNVANWDTVTAGVFAMVGTSVGGLAFTNLSHSFFNGSFNVGVVPDPSTLTVAALAGVGLVVARFRRRR